MREGNHKHLKGELRRFEYRMTGEVFLRREKTYVEIYVRMPSGETVVFVGAEQLTLDERFELAVSLAHLMGLPVDVWYSEGEDGCLHIHEIQVDSPHYLGTGMIGGSGGCRRSGAMNKCSAGGVVMRKQDSADAQTQMAHPLLPLL